MMCRFQNRGYPLARAMEFSIRNKDLTSKQSGNKEALKFVYLKLGLVAGVVVQQVKPQPAVLASYRDTSSRSCCSTANLAHC